MNEEEFKKLKQQVADATDEANKARGALEQILKDLKTNFDCRNIGEAERHLATLKMKLTRAQTAFEEAQQKYQKKWKKEK